MDISLDNVACVVGMVFLFGGLIAAAVETRFKVKQLMDESKASVRRYDDCRKHLFMKQDDIIAGQADLRQRMAEVTGDLKTSIMRNSQKIDDLVDWLKRNGNGGNKNG